MAAKSKINPLKMGLLVAGAGVGGYALWKMNQGGAGGNPISPIAPKPIVGKKPKPVQPIIKRQWRAATFPLQKGMQGDVIGQMQLMLQKLGTKTQADGKFGSETEMALNHLGLPPIVSAETFQSLKVRTTKAPIAPNETAYQKLVRLGYNATTEIEVAIKLRRELTAPVINDGKVRTLLTAPTKTLTNIQRAYQMLYKAKVIADLENLSLSRIRFNEQITRLQALSGFGALASSGQRLITTGNTLIKAKTGGFMNVKANTILGVQVANKNGTAWFKNQAGVLMKVPASDVKLM